MPIRKDKLQFYHKARITISFGTSLKIIALQMAEKVQAMAQNYGALKPMKKMLLVVKV